MGSKTLPPGDTEPVVTDNVALKSPVCPAKTKLKTDMLSLSVFLSDFIRTKKYIYRAQLLRWIARPMSLLNSGQIKRTVKRVSIQVVVESKRERLG
jgi:hypothetical protein